MSFQKQCPCYSATSLGTAFIGTTLGATESVDSVFCGASGVMRTLFLEGGVAVFYCCVRHKILFKSSLIYVA